MKNDEPFADCWQDLADAIILQAVSDFRKTQKLLKQKSDNKEQLLELHRLERFFRSNWFKALTTLDGSQLLTDLRKEAA